MELNRVISLKESIIEKNIMRQIEMILNATQFYESFMHFYASVQLQSAMALFFLNKTNFEYVNRCSFSSSTKHVNNFMSENC